MVKRGDGPFCYFNIGIFRFDLSFILRHWDWAWSGRPRHEGKLKLGLREGGDDCVATA
jgi:hypothetical protein